MQWNDWALLVALIVLPFVGLRHRRWFVRCCLTLLASIFWGALFAGAVGWLLGISGDPRLLLVGLPVSIAIGAFFWRRSEKMMEQHFD
jgi:Na+/citrate or Na+/malate symporter